MAAGSCAVPSAAPYRYDEFAALPPTRDTRGPPRRNFLKSREGESRSTHPAGEVKNETVKHFLRHVSTFLLSQCLRQVPAHRHPTRIQVLAETVLLARVVRFVARVPRREDTRIAPRLDYAGRPRVHRPSQRRSAPPPASRCIGPGLPLPTRGVGCLLGPSSSPGPGLRQNNFTSRDSYPGALPVWIVDEVGLSARVFPTAWPGRPATTHVTEAGEGQAMWGERTGVA